MRPRKQSMREVRDAATVERNVAILGDLALEQSKTRQTGRDKPIEQRSGDGLRAIREAIENPLKPAPARFFRGARVRGERVKPK